jgi:hypothetical protein
LVVTSGVERLVKTKRPIRPQPAVDTSVTAPCHTRAHTLGHVGTSMGSRPGPGVFADRRGHLLLSRSTTRSVAVSQHLASVCACPPISSPSRRSPPCWAFHGNELVASSRRTRTSPRLKHNCQSARCGFGNQSRLGTQVTHALQAAGEPNEPGYWPALTCQYPRRALLHYGSAGQLPQPTRRPTAPSAR